MVLRKQKEKITFTTVQIFIEKNPQVDLSNSNGVVQELIVISFYKKANKNTFMLL